ncbi:unnamed protein product [Protopolystoma xenopodis]|uniref:Transmembrane protein n=1 Tax=Protopolystoma xenopodis TaxID=117903 RepID=A0A448WX68_9PLAT|nr:unnamed protein product [Protopolystoma xenopodis]
MARRPWSRTAKQTNSRAAEGRSQSSRADGAYKSREAHSGGWRGRVHASGFGQGTGSNLGLALSFSFSPGDSLLLFSLPASSLFASYFFFNTHTRTHAHTPHTRSPFRLVVSSLISLSLSLCVCLYVSLSHPRPLGLAIFSSRAHLRTVHVLSQSFFAYEAKRPEWPSRHRGPDSPSRLDATQSAQSLARRTRRLSANRLPPTRFAAPSAVCVWRASLCLCLCVPVCVCMRELASLASIWLTKPCSNRAGWSHAIGWPSRTDNAALAEGAPVRDSSGQTGGQVGPCCRPASSPAFARP